MEVSLRSASGWHVRFKVRLLEVASVGGFALRENGHELTVGLRPNPAKQVVEAVKRI